MAKIVHKAEISMEQLQCMLASAIKKHPPKRVREAAERGSKLNIEFISKPTASSSGHFSSFTLMVYVTEEVASV